MPSHGTNYNDVLTGYSGEINKVPVTIDVDWNGLRDEYAQLVESTLDTNDLLQSPGGPAATPQERALFGTHVGGAATILTRTGSVPGLDYMLSTLKTLASNLGLVLTTGGKNELTSAIKPAVILATGAMGCLILS
jgi:hypothetical protein